MSVLPNGARDLSGAGTVSLVEQRLIRPGDVTLNPGGMETTGCVAHLRVIDLPSAVAWFVPCNARMLKVIRDQCDQLLAALEQTTAP